MILNIDFNEPCENIIKILLTEIGREKKNRVLRPIHSSANFHEIGKFFSRKIINF